MTEKVKPIIIQGAMRMEIEELLKIIEIEKEENINGFEFYIGKLNNYPIVISETQIGIINASMATCIGIQKYNPRLIINQGIAGTHVNYIHRNDIVVGEKGVNINSFITGIKSRNEGTNPFEWQFDNRSFEVNCNRELLEKVKQTNSKYNVFYGIIGSGDIFNREVDRIAWLQEKKNTLCEDNETIAIYAICDKFKVPCIGFRAITNNEVTQKESDGSTISRKNLSSNANRIISKEHDLSPAIISQKFTINFIKEILLT